MCEQEREKREKKIRRHDKFTPQPVNESGDMILVIIFAFAL